MNKKVFFTLLLIMGMVYLSTCVRADVNSSIEVYYDFENFSGGTLHDVSGNGRDATEQGSTGIFIEEEGIIGSGTYMNISNSNGIQNNNFAPNYDKISLSVWVKVNQSQINNWTSGNYLLSWERITGGTLDTYIYINHDKTISYAFSCYLDSGTCGATSAETINLSKEWNHIVTTTSGSGSTGGKLYLNGELIHETYFNEPVQNLGSRFGIGTRYNVVGDSKFTLDEISVYSAALSQSDIAILYNDGYGYNPISGLNNTNVALTSPIDNYQTNNEEINFNYDLLSEFQTCYFYHNQTGTLTINQTSTISNITGSYSFNESFEPGNYSWRIGCNNTQYVKFSEIRTFEQLESIVLTNFNLTSLNSIYDNNWNTEPRTRAYTLDTTPTIKFNTKIDVICRIGVTDVNYTAMGASRSCSTTGERNHTCTLINADELELNNQSIYTSCGGFPYITEQSTSDSGELLIGIKTVPSEPQLNYPENNSLITFNLTSTIASLNWSPSTDTDGDDISYYIYVNDTFEITLNETQLQHNYTLPIPSTSGTTINWTVISGDGLYNSTNQYYYFTSQPQAYLYLNGKQINRTYEYSSIADLKVNTSGYGDVCLSIYDVNHGVNFKCGTNETSYNYTISNYTATTAFGDGKTNDSVYFRKDVEESIDLNLPTYLDVVTATIDLTGKYSPEYIDRFDDWNKTQQSKNYTFVGPTLLNITVRDSNIFKSASFDIISPNGAQDLSIDVCNDGTIDINLTGYFLTPTKITFDDISILNDCVNTSKDFNVIPLNFTFGTYQEFMISEIEFKRSELFKPRDAYLDAGNDSIIDDVFLGEISGRYGAVDVYSDGTYTKNIISLNSSGKSELLYVNIPATAQIIDFSMVIKASSDNDVYEETFYTTNYINLTTTNALQSTFFGQVRNRIDSQDRPLESFIYSKKIPSLRQSIREITWTATDVQTEDGSNIIYYITTNGGSDWTTITDNGKYTIQNPGNETYWYANMKSNLVNSTYITKLRIQGLDSNPYNLTIDVGNNGHKDYKDSAEQSWELREIEIPYTQFNNEQNSQISMNGLITVPINISFNGKGTLHITGIEVEYSLDDVSIKSSSVTSFIYNIKTAITTIVSLLTGDSYESNDNATFSMLSNGIISSSSIKLVGDYNE